MDHESLNFWSIIAQKIVGGSAVICIVVFETFDHVHHRVSQSHTAKDYLFIY